MITCKICKKQFKRISNTHLKNHNLNAYLDLPSPFQEGDGKVVVRFLNNIRLSEVEKLKEEYRNKYIN